MRRRGRGGFRLVDGSYDDGLGSFGGEAIGGRRIENDDIHAAIHGAAFGSGVGRHGAVFGIASSGEPGGIEVVDGDEKLDEVGGARGGELPIRIETGVVNRNIVRVTFDAQRFGAGAKKSGESLDSRL